MAASAHSPVHKQKDVKQATDPINNHMEFSPFNPVVKYCIRGMEMEDKNQPDKALNLFTQGWNEATTDFEKFLAAYYIARQQKTAADQLKWLQTALDFGIKSNDESVKGALPSLYFKIARCYANLGDPENAQKNDELGTQYKDTPSDTGPFYHGTKADLRVGDLLTAGGVSNYKPDLVMNHIYFTALVNGAGLAATLAKGDGPERVYIVEPTGKFENDPNVTDKKFPGNPTRSYRSLVPLRIVGEVTDWVRPTAAELERFRERLIAHKGKIMN